MRKLLATALILAGCHGDGSSSSGGTAAPATAEFLHGVTPDEDGFGSMVLDASGDPRVVWRRSGAGIDEIVFASRAGGTWSSPVSVSDDALVANVKSAPHAVLSPINQRLHVFWHETAGAAPGIHYATFDANGAAVGLDTVISTTAPANAATATMGNVTAGTLTVLVNPATSDVVAAWAQLVDADGGGAGAADEVVVVGVVAGGAGAFGEHFAMTTPDTGATAADVVATADPPIVLVAAGGVLHVLWVGTTAGGSAAAVRHQARTGVATYSPGGNGDVVSDTTGQSYRYLRAAAAADGDLVAMWAQSTLPVRRVEAAYRPAGGTFAASLIVDPAPAAAPMDLVAIDLALDPTTEVAHFFYKRASGGSIEVAHQSYTAGLAAVLQAEEILGATTFAGSSAGTITGALNGNSEAAIVWDGPRVAGGSDFDVFHAVRPSGGAFQASVNLTDSTADSRLAGAFRFASGSLAIAVIEGPAAGAREVLGSRYDTGAGFAALRNLSQTPLTDTHGDTDPGRVAIVGNASDLAVHYLFREHTGSATHDLAYKRE